MSLRDPKKLSRAESFSVSIDSPFATKVSTPDVYRSKIDREKYLREFVPQVFQTNPQPQNPKFGKYGTRKQRIQQNKEELNKVRQEHQKINEEILLLKKEEESHWKEIEQKRSEENQEILQEKIQRKKERQQKLKEEFLEHQKDFEQKKENQKKKEAVDYQNFLNQIDGLTEKEKQAKQDKLNRTLKYKEDFIRHYKDLQEYKKKEKQLEILENEKYLKEKEQTDRIREERKKQEKEQLVTKNWARDQLLETIKQKLETQKLEEEKIPKSLVDEQDEIRHQQRAEKTQQLNEERKVEYNELLKTKKEKKEEESDENNQNEEQYIFGKEYYSLHEKSVSTRKSIADFQKAQIEEKLKEKQSQYDSSLVEKTDVFILGEDAF